MLKVDYDMIEKINKLYLEIGTYAGVSRKLGGSPSPATVKKYIIPNFSLAVKKKEFKPEDIPTGEWNGDIFIGVDNYGDLCVFNEEEVKEMKEFNKEIVM